MTPYTLPGLGLALRFLTGWVRGEAMEALRRACFERESRLYSAQRDVDWQRQYVIDQFRELDRREAHLKALQARRIGE